MDGDLRIFQAEQREGPAPAVPAPPSGAPERIAELCRRVIARRALPLDLPDLAGCYDYDL
jgi:hypothetical protein